eukprot:6256192-Amphidinium_carterae.1
MFQCQLHWTALSWNGLKRSAKGAELRVRENGLKRSAKGAELRVRENGLKMSAKGAELRVKELFTSSHDERAVDMSSSSWLYYFRGCDK